MAKTEKQTGVIIRVSPEVVEHLKAHGDYGDTMDSIIRRRLGLPEKKKEAK